MAFSKSTELLESLQNFGLAYGPAAVPLANGKALELWLMLKLAEGAKKDGWTVDLCDGAGAVLAAGAPFRPRGQHGKIARASSNGPGFIRLSKGKPDGTTIVVELHDSLQWNGRSDASHECDLSVIDAGVAQALRTNGGGHPIGLPLIAIECKDKDSPGPIGDVREQVARLFDLTQSHGARSATERGRAERLCRAWLTRDLHSPDVWREAGARILPTSRRGWGPRPA